MKAWSLLILFNSLTLAAQAPLSVLVLGDWGTGKKQQAQVAQGMIRYCRSHPCDFVLTVGDNFYPKGVQSSSDPQWKLSFEKQYQPLGLRFFPVFGNHDVEGSRKAQLDYTQLSTLWNFPRPYYQFKRKGVEFFALDTTDFDSAQKKWLQLALQKSTASWKIVYGHHPIRSYGHHGNNRKLFHELEPLLTQHRVSFYISGHEHDKQLLRSPSPTHHLICGSGGAPLRRTSAGPLSLFQQSSHGFCLLDFHRSHAALKVLDRNGREQFLHAVPVAK